MQHFLIFFLTSALLGVVPGPDNLFVLAQSAMHGSKAGIVIVLGLCSGLIVQTCAVSLGLATVFSNSMLAFTLLKYAGAAYLVWLGYQAFREGAQSLSTPQTMVLSKRALYLRGIAMNLTNPKVSVFFLAFLPQFVDSRWGHVSLQLALLGGLFIVATLIVFSSIALLAGTFGTKLANSPRAQTAMNRLAGLVFLALAAKLAISQH